MARHSISQFSNGDAVDEVFLVAEKQTRLNRQGNPYLLLDLRDKSGAISARHWNAPEESTRSFEAGDYLRVRGKVQLYQGSLQLILSQFDRVPGDQVDPEEFLPRSSQSIGKLTGQLRDLLRSVKEPQLRCLVDCFLMDEGFMAKFTLAPAGVKNHHAYQGGLLEHVVTLMSAADRLSPIYPDLDRDLLLTGAFLHDIGKIDELYYERGFGYTDDGQLVGHLVMGVEILQTKVNEAEKLMDEPFREELRLRLRHMIVSHHGTGEFGSPKTPMTLEAVALHHLDTLDAKMHSTARELREDPAESTWTAYNPGLGRRLFKGSGPGNGSVVGTAE